jgi:ferritin-like metal-binding protein YciE
MKLDTLKTLYINELKDLYNAEGQLLKALPKMAKGASSEELEDAFEKHLEQTKTHVERLEEVFKEIGETPKGKTCRAMKGLIEEGSEILQEDGEESVIDAGIIVAAQKVEHYEMRNYWAKTGQLTFYKRRSTKNPKRTSYLISWPKISSIRRR